MTTVTFEVEPEYGAETIFRTESFTEAVNYMNAAALHTGRNFQVKRVSVDSTGTASAERLLSVRPYSHDFRQISPEMALRMKAMAAELRPDIGSL